MVPAAPLPGRFSESRPVELRLSSGRVRIPTANEEAGRILAGRLLMGGRLGPVAPPSGRLLAGLSARDRTLHSAFNALLSKAVQSPHDETTVPVRIASDAEGTEGWSEAKQKTITPIVTRQMHNE